MPEIIVKEEPESDRRKLITTIENLFEEKYAKDKASLIKDVVRQTIQSLSEKTSDSRNTCETIIDQSPVDALLDLTCLSDDDSDEYEEGEVRLTNRTPMIKQEACAQADHQSGNTTLMMPAIPAFGQAEIRTGDNARQVPLTHSSQAAVPRQDDVRPKKRLRKTTNGRALEQKIYEKGEGASMSAKEIYEILRSSNKIHVGTDHYVTSVKEEWEHRRDISSTLDQRVKHKDHRLIKIYKEGEGYSYKLADFAYEQHKEALGH